MAQKKSMYTFLDDQVHEQKDFCPNNKRRSKLLDLQPKNSTRFETNLFWLRSLKNSHEWVNFFSNTKNNRFFEETAVWDLSKCFTIISNVGSTKFPITIKLCLFLTILIEVKQNLQNSNFKKIVFHHLRINKNEILDIFLM